LMGSNLRWETTTGVSLSPILQYDEDLTSCSWHTVACMMTIERYSVRRSSFLLLAGGERMGWPAGWSSPFCHSPGTHSAVDGHGTTACTDRRWMDRPRPAGRRTAGLCRIDGSIDTQQHAKAAVPGSRHAPVARGTARLSRRGHAPLCSGTRRDRIREATRPRAAPASCPRPSRTRAAVRLSPGLAAGPAPRARRGNWASASGAGHRVVLVRTGTSPAGTPKNCLYGLAGPWIGIIGVARAIRAPWWWPHASERETPSCLLLINSCVCC